MEVKKIACFLIVGVCAWLPMSLQGQNKPQFERKVYVDDKNHVYVQDSLPVYLFISTTPDGSGAVKLQSESQPKLVNPMYFDGHGRHHLIHKDYDHEVEVKYDIYADGIAPATVHKKEGAPLFQKDDKLYCGKDLKIRLISSDEMSGVDKTYYSIDPVDFVEYTSLLSFDTEHDYVLKYFSVDHTGNAEKIHSQKFTVDLTAPTTQYSLGGDNFQDTILSSNAKITLNASDALSGIEGVYYKLDNKPTAVYSEPITTAGLSEGSHVLVYFSIDNVKNKEEKNEFHFYLDRTAPVVLNEVLGDSYFVNGKEYSSGRSKLKLTAVDNKAGVKAIYYSINGAEYKKYDAPIYMPATQGNMVLKTYALDNVNNRTGANKEANNLRASYVDLTGPELSYSFKGLQFKERDTSFITPKTDIILKARDNESGLKEMLYSLDEQSEMGYEKSFRVSKEGSHHVEFSAYDNVNNSSNAHLHFIVDDAGPEIFPRFSITPIGTREVKGKKLDVYPPHMVLFLSATDTQSGFLKMSYSLNGAKEQPYTGIIRGFLPKKNYTLKVKAWDELNNQRITEIEFAIE